MKKSVVITVVLIIAVLAGVFFSGGGNSDTEKTGIRKDALYTEDTVLGDGEKSIEVEVIVENESVTFILNTDKETVGEALLEHKLIEGEKGPYGLYVKYVNGIKADYDENRTYWAFSKDSNPLETGVDMTKIEDGAKYEFTYTK